ncbi:hypothetical protein [Actinacidiphila glaucinigra]|uniref:Mercuric ion transport protein n=1 Tax=Actinacidiphila glaucinigra TaxID=235986 RepID=A0A239NYW8_9ACTN|nr:hypothetical protein [Actinacidiphila glaucinigra]SNT59618.1 mercuric ion transport protein [Actinacidiphila glaucinigra]
MATTPPSRPSAPWGTIGVGVAALVACAVCCAGPLLAVLGGIGIPCAIGALWVPVLAVQAAAALVAVIFIVRRRRRRPVPCHTIPTHADLGMPNVRLASERTTPAQ